MRPSAVTALVFLSALAVAASVRAADGIARGHHALGVEVYTPLRTESPRWSGSESPLVGAGAFYEFRPIPYVAVSGGVLFQTLSFAVPFGLHLCLPLGPVEIAVGMRYGATWPWKGEHAGGIGRHIEVPQLRLLFAAERNLDIGFALSLLISEKYPKPDDRVIYIENRTDAFLPIRLLARYRF